MATTTDALDGLLAIRDGDLTARWNYPAAVGTPLASPGGVGTSVALSYCFLTALPSYSGEYLSPVTGFQAFDEAAWGMCTAARTALQKIGEVIGVTFTEVAAGTTEQLTFAMNAQSGSSGYAYFPSYGTTSQNGTIASVTASPVSGDIWISNTPTVAWTAAAFQVGGFGYETLIHEVCHALGLKHPFDGASTLDAAYDQNGFTVMSYTEPLHSVVVTPGSTANSYTYRNQSVSSLMLGDIRALQYVYGANNAGRAGNDTYQWTDRETFFTTLWDGGGTDVIDCSNQTLDCIINLTPGSYSSIGLRRTEAELLAQTPDITLAWVGGQWGTSYLERTGRNILDDLYNGSNNLAIADNVVIETVRGGGAADSITGNSAANLIEGGNGADTLVGGIGNDTLDGGAGSDTVSFAGARTDYAVRRTVSGFVVTDNVVAGLDEGSDTLAGIEILNFSDQTFTLASDSASTGSLSVTGTAIQGMTLTVASTLADADGLGSLSYQWQADGSDIAGATGASLVLTQSLVGKAIRVAASHTDGLGVIESATSAASGVVANANDAPALAVPAAVSLTDTAANDSFTAATGTLSATDADQNTLSYGIVGGTDQGATVSKAGSYGTLVVAKAGGAYTFTPADAAVEALRANATESFTVTAADGSVAASSLRFADFAGADTASQWNASSWANGNAFRSTWQADHAVVAGGALNLQMSADGLVSAEYASSAALGYGTYSARLKAVAGSGIITSLFTYTGTPHDEIDIEILGKDTTKVQFNYFTAGVSAGHEATVDLGFDAAADYHLYAFDWQQDHIAWYVDGVLKHQVTSAAGALPSTPGQLMANLWAAQGVDSWSGAFTPGASSYQASYDWIRYEPAAVSTAELAIQVAGANDAPVLATPLADQSATVGTVFGYTVPSSAYVDADSGDSLTYTAALADGSALPAWLTFTADSRAFSGTPTASGSLSVRVTATDSAGLAVSDAFALAVAAAGGSGLTVAVQAYAWKSHALLTGVSIDTSPITGADGIIALIPALPVDDTAVSAVNLQDAIAILKMIVGLDVNGTNKPLSPYQAIAADFDGTGGVNLSDAIGVLKHVVGLTAPAPAWLFVDEADPSIPTKATLDHGVVAPVLSLDATVPAPSLGLVGVLRGDVDGSWTAPAGSPSLDVAHFHDLVASHAELNLAQWGIYA